MGQGHSAAPHEPLGDRHRNSRRSLRHIKPDKGTSPRRMDRLRRSFRDSFKRRKDLHIPESSKPHQWQSDESAVRSGTCNFHVKYLGCVEVFESRGMQVCEEALKVLRNSRRRPVKAILHVSGDGLRVVEDETKGLIVDQTIEKVSFCAPDRNCEKGFSYICRDGTTRRWMCHGFLALRESGERLSHAVGCAFAACLERKQKRDKECGVTMTFDNKNSTFTRTGSFRQASITDRLQDPQDVKPTEPPPVKQVFNPYAIERPHATVSMLQRQGSFRGFQQLNQASPFKRQMSLRISDLPSTLERQRSLSLEGSDFRLPPAHMKVPPVVKDISDIFTAGPQIRLAPVRGRLQSLPSALAHVDNMSPIPEASPLSDRSCGGDSVAAMCQQLAQGLSLLSSADDLDPAESIQNKIATSSPLFINKTVKTSVPASAGGMTATTSASHSLANHSAMSGTADTLRYTSNSNNNNPVTNSLWSSGLWNQTPHTNANHVAAAVPAPPVSTVGPVTPVFPRAELPDPEQWLGTVVSSTVKASPTPLKRAPPLSQHLRAHSLGSSPFPDPFDAEWASVSSRNHKTVNTNPFVTAAPIKAFEGLIVDQTIEKVSFCAPDRNCEKGFSYICRDGTTRRWMCHGFLALRESGERLSHAVGCAFAACLERKQKRDKECGVTMTFDNKNSTFTRTGSFRQASITDRLQDPQDVKPTEPPPVKQVFNPYAIERPHATVSMLQRQGSFRGFQQLNQASPFKRQMSLRISDLPSTLERQRSLSLEGSDFRLPPAHMKVPPVVKDITDIFTAGPQIRLAPVRGRLQSLPSALAHVDNMSPIPEASPLSDRSCGGDSVAAMCQQLAQGLSLLSSADDLDPAESIQNKIATSSPLFINKTVKTSVPASAGGMTATTSASHSLANHSAMSGTADTLRYTSNSNNNNPVTNSLWSSGLWNQTPHTNANHVAAAVPAPPVSTVGPVTPVFPRAELPDPEQWLGTVVSSTVKASPTPLKRAPPLSQHLRAHSLGSSPFPDPFDAEWASVSSRNHKTVNTNPFVTAAPIKAFEVQM